jgi:hypothetical protein
MEVSEQSRFHTGLSWQQELSSISTDATDRFVGRQGLNALVGYWLTSSDRIDFHLGIGRAQHVSVTEQVTYVDTTFTHDGQTTANILGVLTHETVQRPSTTMAASIHYLRTIPSLPLVGELQLHAGLGLVSIARSLGADWSVGVGRSTKVGGPVSIELSVDLQQALWTRKKPSTSFTWASTVLYSW